MDGQSDLTRTLLARAMSLREAGASAALEGQASRLTRAERRRLARKLRNTGESAAQIAEVIGIILRDPSPNSWRRPLPAQRSAEPARNF